MGRYGKDNIHEFYCLNCGKKGIPLFRNPAKQYSKSHLKKLYCPNCKLTVNHYECRTAEEIAEFKEQFAAGAFKEQAIESIQHIKEEESLWQRSSI